MAIKIKPQKTVRFTQLVQTAGKPVPVTLWTAPDEDPVFSKATREKRVLTVVQRNVGTKADYGLIGFFQEPLASYLVFPKPLPYPPETRVIGIKYEELAEARPAGPLHKPKPPKPSKRAHPPKEKPEKRPSPPSPPPPKLHRFGAELEIITRQGVPLEVEATSASEAERLLKAKGDEIPPDPAVAAVTRRISRARRLDSED
jgi:hypothetical protein